MMETTKMQPWHIHETDTGRWQIRRVSHNGGVTAKNFRHEVDARAEFDRWHENGHCVECAQPLDDGYVEPYKTRITEQQTCFTCLFWLEYVRDTENPTHVRVNGWHYVIKPDPPKGFRGSVGHGGSEFRFQLNDGRLVVSRNVWSQGIIPDHFRERLTDNAVPAPPVTPEDET